MWAEGLIFSLHKCQSAARSTDVSLNKLMHNSTRLIMIWWHVVASKSAALMNNLSSLNFLKGFFQEVWPTSSKYLVAHELEVCVVHCVLNVWM